MNTMLVSDSRRSSIALVIAALSLVAVLSADAVPRIGYVYPAGGRAGSTIEVEIGGQYLRDPVDVIVSGGGVKAIIREHNKLPPAAVISDYRDKLRELSPEIRALGDEPDLTPAAMYLRLEKVLEGAELSEKKLRQIDQYTRERRDLKRQLNSQLGETVRVRIELAEDANPGMRYLRLLSESGLSNPVRFMVGVLPEGNEPKAWTFDLATYVGLKPKPKQDPSTLQDQRVIRPPATVNGRILPGDVDEFFFAAEEGDQMVISLKARNLIPYLADAVPGWFQAVVSLLDEDGNEIAFADDYRFDPDPVLFYRMPRTGTYKIRVHDSIYRGREDFVYRITVGELPFLTGVFPLGGPAGGEVDLKLSGGNLTEKEMQRYPLPETPGIIRISAPDSEGLFNTVPFHVDNVPESDEREDNNRLGRGNDVAVPSIVNGSIGAPGDVDFYRIEAAGGRPLTVEIFARRLGSPLDSNLIIFDSNGKQIASNDDFANPSAGLTTHHADARVTIKPPGGGTCFVRVADTQHRGGSSYPYRMKVTQGPPAFALRATPSSLNGFPGGSVQCTVHVVRLDGFEGAIRLSLKDAPEGFSLKNASIPAGEDSAKISITLPSSETDKPIAISLQGTAQEDDRSSGMIDVAPAEDMIQAFITPHLVPVDALLVNIRRKEQKDG
jgi:hypothetical protein